MAPKHAKLQIFIQVTFISFKTFTTEKKLKPAKNDQIWLVFA